MSQVNVGDCSAIAAYYRHPAVRARIREYCGADDGASPSCVFVSAALPEMRPPVGWTLDARRPPADLDDLLDRGGDVFRSIWDRISLPICIDLDYLNAEFLGHAFARPRKVFPKLEPIYAAVVALLQEYGIGTLALMTGRGYQFSGRIPLDCSLVEQLATFAPGVPDWYETQAKRLPPWMSDRQSPTYARAYVATGLILEYFAHQIIQRAARTSSIPIVVNGTNVGHGAEGREAVSIDLSFAGDPLDVRHMRVAFGGYQHHRFRPDVYGPEVSALDPLVTVPRSSESLDDMVDRHRTPEGAALLAESSCATMPTASNGFSLLAAEYRESALARFHESFYAIEPHGPAAWRPTYDRLDLTTLPPCVAAPLAEPNDRLLKPEHLQHVTRFLMSEGWAPRHVAGLVWSRYEKDFRWGARWAHLSPRARADFDVRVFAGMIVTGLDRGVDFNCRSAQEKRLCPFTGCQYDLRVSRNRLLARPGLT
jgi:hypothetical protein